MIALYGLIAGALATGLMRELAPRLGWVAAPNSIVPQHRAPTALLGGVGIVIGALTAAALGGVRPDREAFALALPALALLALGLLDDLRPLSAGRKLAGQVVVALAAVALGVRAPVTGSPWLDAAVAVGWIVLVVNAVNVTDVCDGLAAGLAAIGLVALGAWDPASRAYAWALAGASAGFLAFNRPPASIFMGDAGSLVLGYALAALSLRVLSHDGPWPGVAFAVAASALFLFETTFLIAVRHRKHLPFWRASPDHFSLRMQAAGLSKWTTDLASWGAAALACGTAGLLPALPMAERIACLTLALIAAAGWAQWLLQHEVRRG